MDVRFRESIENGTPVLLVGFMGSGKSTIGRMLARKLGYRFLDLDEEIETNAGKSVREIFAESGEAEFRRLERDAICGLAAVSRAVVSLGGGAYVPDENRTRIRRIGITIWIDCPLELCWSRLQKDETRPLLRTFPEMAALLESRLAAYKQVDLIVRTESDSPAKIAHRITEQFGLLESGS